MNAQTLIYSVIGIVVLFLVVAALIPTLNTATETVGNISGLPLGGLFASNGVIILIFMAAIVVGAIAILGFGKKH